MFWSISFEGNAVYDGTGFTEMWLARGEARLTLSATLTLTLAPTPSPSPTPKPNVTPTRTPTRPQQVPQDDWHERIKDHRAQGGAWEGRLAAGRHRLLSGMSVLGEKCQQGATAWWIAVCVWVRVCGVGWRGWGGGLFYVISVAFTLFLWRCESGVP